LFDCRAKRGKRKGVITKRWKEKRSYCFASFFRAERAELTEDWLRGEREKEILLRGKREKELLLRLIFRAEIAELTEGWG